MPSTPSIPSSDFGFGNAPGTSYEEPAASGARLRREHRAWAATIGACGVLLAGMAFAAPLLPGADTVPHSAGCRVETAHLCR